MTKKSVQLTDEIRAAIVQALGCYGSPSEVAEAVKEMHGLEVSRQTVESYDPTKYAGQRLSKRWRDLFTDARKRFLADLDEIPIAHKAYRLRRLWRMMERAEHKGNITLVLQILEQAAKEMGDVYTNRQKVDANLKVAVRTVIVPAKA
jgi:hypothetical protein